MTELLRLDDNAIALPTADLSFRSGLKVVIHKVVAVCTSNYLFAFPTQVTSASMTGRARQSSEVSMAPAVQEITSKVGQTVDGLERELLQLAEGRENVAFKLSELKAYRLKGWGPFRQFGLWKQGQSIPMSFVPRGKGEMKRFEAFCVNRGLKSA
jgi:hypothetical protein